MRDEASTHLVRTVQPHMSSQRQHTELLVQAGRLLLEYDESTGAIHRVLTSTAKALTDDICHVAVLYNGVTVSLAGGAPLTLPVREIRYNLVVQERVHAILNRVRSGELGLASALDELKRVESAAPRHSRWVAVVMLGAAAASLAGILGADINAASIAGLSTGLGLLARQELGRRHFSLLTLPFAATFIGAVIGSLAIRWGLTQTPGLVLIVPGLMLVPGPHFINGVLDLLDNFVPMCLARLGLAMGIMLTATLGIVLGIELILPGPLLPGSGTSADRLNVVTDALLAGVATCGFAVFYNAAWPQVGLAAVGGMAGHGIRFIALESDLGLDVATFLGGLTVGIVSAWFARAGRMPVAVVSFAGAVTMMPGLQMYRALGGAMKLARLQNDADPTTIAETMGSAFEACLMAGGLALGLIIGARLTLALTERLEGVALND